MSDGIGFEIVMLVLAAVCVVVLVATREQSDDTRKWKRIRRDMKRRLLDKNGGAR